MLLAREGHQCIICELTGQDINRYNKMTTYYEKHQDIINEGIPILNRTIYAMNHDDNLPTPFLQNSIHHKNSKREPHMMTKYTKLYDGLHPDEKTAQVWLQQIIKFFEFEWGFYALLASKAIFRARTYNCITYSVR